MLFRKSLTGLVMIGLLLITSAGVMNPSIAQTQKRPRSTQPAVYSCPMHPDFKSRKPGKCPKCGMTLRLVRENDAQPAAEKPEEKPVGEKLSIPDLEVLDQDGRKLHFYTDLVKDHVVAINFIFTTCTTICPPLSATFARVQKDLGERVGRDVQMISISVDPMTDTPERLKAFSEKFHAAPGWTFITGAKPQIDALLRALGAATASPQDHSPTVLIGNDARGIWTRTYGLAPPSQLVQLINNAAENGSQ